ncbi:hypothetical protein R1flu_016159 [Riccia fluitans]|uniref:ATVPS33 vacuolar protein sorting 33 n=1 Tax=Riccia fluitans TaxID=41844 RepID=A0ABD1YL09_9MARC
MAQIPSLDHAPINLVALREQAQKELIQVLSSVRGKKVLILDPKLSGPLALIAQPTLLKENGVENLYHLSADPVPSECKNVLYLVRPRIALMKLISSQITQDNIQKLQKSHTLVFCPRRTIVCEKVLEEEGILNNVTILEYPLHFIPFDEDVLSLELDTAFKETKVDGDLSAIWYLARAITLLQSQFGVIPNIKGKGKAAVQVADILTRMQREQNPDTTAAAVTPEIDTMILIDRQVDLVTPMCWQLTYEGLIDEFLTLSNGAVELDPSIMGITQPGVKKAKVPLNSSDKLYRELRDLNFGVVGQVLRNKATSMKQDYNEVTGGGPQHQSVSELKDFVKKLNALPELTRHTNIAQHLSTYTTKSKFLTRLSIEQTLVEGQSYDISFEYVEEMIHRQEPLTSVLRLLVLLSLTSGGLQKKHFDYLRREFLHAYGFEHLFTLSNLEKAGLLRKQEAKNSWQNIKRGLKLVVEDQDDANPTDVSYVFSGYAPLSIRLVQQALKGGWKAVDDLLKLLPGQSFDKKQGVTPDHGVPSREGSVREGSVTSDSAPAVDGRRAVVLVVFIGGVTFAEISALRFLGAQEGMKYDFVVATTKLINGTTLLKSMVEEG